LILWAGANRDVALKMVFMYGSNGRRLAWWDEVILLVWEPSQKLLVEDEELQARLAGTLGLGVRAIVCKACADEYGIADRWRGWGLRSSTPVSFSPTGSSPARRCLRFSG